MTMQTNWRMLCAGLLTVALGAFLAPQAEAVTINVNPGDDLAAKVATATAGDLVLVADGTYSVTADILVDDAFTVQSVNGPSVTTVRMLVKPAPHRLFVVTHPGALVTGFAIENAQESLNNWVGSSVDMSAGTVSDCWIQNTPYTGNPQNGSARLTGGLMTDCIFDNSNPRMFAVLVYAGGTVQDTIIRNTFGGFDDGPVQVRGGPCAAVQSTTTPTGAVRISTADGSRIACFTRMPAIPGAAASGCWPASW